MDVDDTRILHTVEALLSGATLHALPQEQRQVLATCLLLYAGAASEGQQDAFVAHLEAWAVTRTAYHANVALCRVLTAELDRLGWSSATAPAGTTCLEAFPTEQAGLIVLEADHEIAIPCATEGLVLALRSLTPSLSYDDLWDALRPYVRD